jgi:hypothetical protein
MISKPKISSLVPSQVPEFVREDYGTFIEFLKAYYEFLEQNYDSDFPKLRDLDTTLDSFLDYFKAELAHNIPYTVVNERFFLEKIKDQYLAKGSEASFKLLFKLLFNKNVVVDYPSRQILRASDGKWNQDVSIFVQIAAGDPDMIVGKIVDVVTANKILRIQVDKRQYVEIEVDGVRKVSDKIYELLIDRRFFGDIKIGDKLRYANIFDATILATTSSVTIQKVGKRFKVGELYEIKNGKGAGSILKISRVNSETGGIEAVDFVKYGVGYTNDFSATLIPYGGVSATQAGATGLSVSGAAPDYAISFGETTDGFFEQGTINKSDYTSQVYWDGTYVGEVVREFFADNKFEILDPDEPAIIKIKLGALAKYPGYYLNNDGFLDDAIFIQDSRYYQAFAYVLKIDERLDKYRSAIKTLIHPAGMALFGEFDIRNEFNTGTSLEFSLKYLFLSLQDEVFTSQDVAIKLMNKRLDDSISESDSNVYLLSKPINDHYLYDGSTPDNNTITPSELTYNYDYDALTRDGISVLNFGKALTDTLSEPTDTISSKNFGKALADSFSLSDTTGLNGARTDPVLDFSKDLSGGHLINNGITTDSESVAPTDVYASLLSKPLATHNLNDDLTEDINTVYLETTPDTTTLLFGKGLTDTLSEPTESISAIDFGKAVTDTLSEPSESISAKDLSKLFQTHLLYNNVTSDTNLVTITDTTGSGSLRTVPYIVLNKSITNTTTNYGGDLDDETVTVTASGNLWLNPYTNPYPETSSYFLNDSGDYTEGESAFTA